MREGEKKPKKKGINENMNRGLSRAIVLDTIFDIAVVGGLIYLIYTGRLDIYTDSVRIFLSLGIAGLITGSMTIHLLKKG